MGKSTALYNKNPNLKSSLSDITESHNGPGCRKLEKKYLEKRENPVFEDLDQHSKSQPFNLEKMDKVSKIDFQIVYNEVEQGNLCYLNGLDSKNNVLFGNSQVSSTTTA